MSEIAKISIRSDYANIKHANAFLNSILSDFSFSDKEKIRLCVALEEALYHTFKNSLDTAEAIFSDIIISKDETTFEIAIINNGVPYLFEGGETDLNELGENADALSAYVMRKVVDNVIYRNLGKKGQEIRLVKNLEQLADFSSEASAPEETVSEPPQISIRTIKPEEVIEITRCVYDEYKYSYPNEDIYYPERVVSLIEEGKLVSFVSVTEKDEIAGHTALKFCNEYPALMDTAIWVVKQKYRGFSIMKTLLPFSLEYANNLDINGVFIEAVTHHPATQKVSKRYGFYATGFYLLYRSPATVVNYETDGNRRSLGIGYRPYKEIKEVNIYVPKEHRLHVAEMYGRFGTTANIMPPKEDLELAENSEMTVNEVMWNLYAAIEIDKCGKDLETALRSEIKRMKQNGIECVMLRANMDDASLLYIYECAKKCGFFYTGFVPHSGKGNLMLLQNLMGGAVKYDSVLALEDYGEVLEYIRQFDPNEIAQ